MSTNNITLNYHKFHCFGKKNCLFHQKFEGILHLLFAGIACKIYFLMPSNFDEKMPLDYDKFCPLKMMAFMVIKGNIICWHFLKALPSADTTPLYSEGNNSIFLRRSFFPSNLRAFHTTVPPMATNYLTLWIIRSIQKDKKSELYIFGMSHQNNSGQSRLGPYMT